jgi:hypothetical protein
MVSVCLVVPVSLHHDTTSFSVDSILGHAAMPDTTANVPAPTWSSREQGDRQAAWTGTWARTWTQDQISRMHPKAKPSPTPTSPPPSLHKKLPVRPILGQHRPEPPQPELGAAGEMSGAGSEQVLSHSKIAPDALSRLTRVVSNKPWSANVYTVVHSTAL